MTNYPYWLVSAISRVVKLRGRFIGGMAILTWFCVFMPEAAAQRTVNDYIEGLITPGVIKKHIAFLSSDSLRGRATPSPGLDAAAEYIARQFKSYGLQSMNGSWFQNLAYCYFDLGKDNFLSVVHGNTTRNFDLKRDFVPYDFSGSGAAEGEMVFVGYGISAPEFHYDDYQEVDVQGKIVVVLRQEPGQTDTTRNEFSGTELSPHAWLTEKQKAARDHGAAGMVVISGPLQFSDLQPDFFRWPSLSEMKPSPPLHMDYCDKPGNPLPVVQGGESLILELFGTLDSLKRIQQRIEKSFKPASFQIRGKSLAMNISFTRTPVQGRNVAAFLQGVDPLLKDEVVIIGAHYDHIGCVKEGHGAVDNIYNGADDNASGTAGILAIASTFGSMLQSPKRSVMFIAFAGEEEGLLGSDSYIRNPLWQLGKTVAMLNLDMISRNDPDSLEIVGANLNPGLMKVVRKVNKTIGFTLSVSKDRRLDGGSDHASFYRAGIPDLFFFTGFHPDYHQVTDEIGKVDAAKAAKVAKLAFMTAWTIANESKHYPMVKAEKDPESQE